MMIKKSIYKKNVDSNFLEINAQKVHGFEVREITSELRYSNRLESLYSIAPRGEISPRVTGFTI